MCPECVDASVRYLENSPKTQVGAVTVLELELPQVKTKSGKGAKEKENA